MAEHSDLKAIMDAVTAMTAALDPLPPVQRTKAFELVSRLLDVAQPVQQVPIAAPMVQAPGPASHLPNGQAAEVVWPKPPVGIKAFCASKKPRTDVEKMAVVAFYLTHCETRPSFRTRDLVEAGVQAAYNFSNPRVTVSQATRRHAYLGTAGSQLHQITSRGEALVNALPEPEKVKSSLAEHPIRTYKKRPGRKKKATKD